MAITKLGAIKIAAKKAGISIEEYNNKISNGLKKCILCKNWKLLENFNTDNSRWDKKDSKCRDCKNNRNPEKISKIEKIEMKLKGFSWCRDCKQFFKSDFKDKGLCKKHSNERYRKYYKTKGKKAIAQRNHARKRNILPVKVKQQEYLLDLFNKKCAYCNIKNSNTWDHVIPISKGGKTTEYNIVPACNNCNSSKKNNDVIKWMNTKKFLISETLKEIFIKLEII